MGQRTWGDMSEAPKVPREERVDGWVGPLNLPLQGGGCAMCQSIPTGGRAGNKNQRVSADFFGGVWVGWFWEGGSTPLGGGGDRV